MHLISNCSYPGVNSWYKKREAKRQSDYFRPSLGPVFVNHLELERKEAEKQAKIEAKALRDIEKQRMLEERETKRAIAKQKAFEEAEARKLLIKQRTIESKDKILDGFDKIKTKAVAFLKNVTTSFSTDRVSESDIAVINSFDEMDIDFNLVEFNKSLIKARNALKEGRYDDFARSEFGNLPLEELECLFDFEDVDVSKLAAAYVNIDKDRIIGKPANIRKNKSLTLGYLRKSSEIDVKKLLEYMRSEDFGTVYPFSIDGLLEWVNHDCKNGVGAKQQCDMLHNINLETLRTELQNAYNSLRGPRTQNQLLVFPNGEKYAVEDFLGDKVA